MCCTSAHSFVAPLILHRFKLSIIYISWQLLLKYSTEVESLRHFSWFYGTTRTARTKRTILHGRRQEGARSPKSDTELEETDTRCPTRDRRSSSACKLRPSAGALPRSRARGSALSSGQCMQVVAGSVPSYVDRADLPTRNWPLGLPTALFA